MCASNARPRPALLVGSLNCAAGAIRWSTAKPLISLFSRKSTFVHWAIFLMQLAGPDGTGGRAWARAGREEPSDRLVENLEVTYPRKTENNSI